MANLSTNDKQILERLFQMGSGYVLNFSDRTFGEFFRDDVRVPIYDEQYKYASGSKANRLRGFWQIASDAMVGRSIEKLIAYINTQILIGSLVRQDFPDELIRRGQNISARLLGTTKTVPVTTEQDFITKEFGNVSIDKLGLDSAINAILKQRIDEIRKCLTAKAALGVIFLYGSTLEGILLGIACTKARAFLS
jgi:hypothetical protein